MKVGLYSVKRFCRQFFFESRYLSLLQHAVQSVVPEGIAGQNTGENTSQRFRMIFVDFHHGQCVCDN